MSRVVSFATVGGMSSGSGSTVATARNLGYAMLQSDWDELRVIRSALDDQYVIVPSGATGTQINQIIADFPTGSSSLWKVVTGCNSAGELVEGCFPTVTCSGFGATTATMLTFKPIQSHVEVANMVLDGASTSSSTGSYGCASPTGEAAPGTGGTNTTTGTYRFRFRNVIAKRARHNPLSWWTGQANDVSLYGFEMINCRVGDGSGAASGNACVMGRPGTNGNVFSARLVNCVLEGQVTGVGFLQNTPGKNCSSLLDGCVMMGNNAGGVQVNTSGGVVLNNCVVTGNSGVGIQLTTAGSITVVGSTITNNTTVGLNDSEWDGSRPAGRFYDRCLIYGNTNGEMAVVDDGEGGDALPLPGDHDRYEPVYRLATGSRVENFVLTNKGVSRGVGVLSGPRCGAVPTRARAMIAGWR